MIVADSLDAMTSNRIYQKRKTLEVAVTEIISLSGVFYHPDVVDALKEIYDAAKINIEDSTQLPLTNMEHERFSYFFKDQMTGFFNESYLWLVLNNQIPNINLDNLAIIELHGMSKYNKLHSWHSGNLLISNFAQYISSIYGNQLIFRVFGDDFALIFREDGVCVEEKINNWKDIKIEDVYTTFQKIDKSIFLEEMLLF
jgi:GGDEF domain-containing protein